MGSKRRNIMKKTMKSRASLKFLFNHPEQYKMFKDVLKSVKQKTSTMVLQRIEKQKNNYLYRMGNDQPNFLFPMEDNIVENKIKPMRSPQRVSWSKTLFEAEVEKIFYFLSTCF